MPSIRPKSYVKIVERKKNSQFLGNLPTQSVKYNITVNLNILWNNKKIKTCRLIFPIVYGITISVCNTSANWILLRIYCFFVPSFFFLNQNQSIIPQYIYRFRGRQLKITKKNAVWNQNYFILTIHKQEKKRSVTEQCKDENLFSEEFLLTKIWEFVDWKKC